MYYLFWQFISRLRKVGCQLVTIREYTSARLVFSQPHIWSHELPTEHPSCDKAQFARNTFGWRIDSRLLKFCFAKTAICRDYWENREKCTPYVGDYPRIVPIKFGWNRPETVGVGFLKIILQKVWLFSRFFGESRKNEMHILFGGTIQGSFLLSLFEVGQKL